MDNSIELRLMTAAMEGLAAAMHEQTVTNQRILEVLLEVVMQDQDPDTQPMHDMDGKPL